MKNLKDFRQRTALHNALIGCGGHDHMVVGFITTYAISAYHHQRCEFEPHSDEVYLIQHYVIKFVRIQFSDWSISNLNFKKIHMKNLKDFRQRTSFVK
jgi:hypothetical protein